ncbi:MAG: hypothetical protein U0R50_01680 [Gaiellales bacterium]
MRGRRLRSLAFAGVLALVLAVPALAIEAETIKAGGISLTVPEGWVKVERAQSDITDPRTLLVVGTKGAKPLPDSECQVAAYRVPADGAVVVVIGWRESIGGPQKLTLKLKRNTFECFAGRGAASQITRNGRDFQVNVMVGDKADADAVAEAVAVARSFAVIRA